MKWVIGGLQILLSVAFLGAGLNKLMGGDPMASNFVVWGYPGWFLILIGVAQLAGALALIAGFWRPILAVLGAAGLGAIMLGAIFTHFFRDPAGPAAAVPSIVLLALSIMVAVYRARQAPIIGRAGSRRTPVSRPI